jgi:hypothetical protein
MLNPGRRLGRRDLNLAFYEPGRPDPVELQWQKPCRRKFSNYILPMQWLSKALTKGPELKADILDAGIELKGSKLTWKLHEGKRKDNGAAASILAFEITASTSEVEISCARNALHRFKTIRHPHVLLYIDGFEPPDGAKTGKVLIVVEHVKPLEQVLAQSPAGQERESCVWGLWTVAQAMHFVNADCHMQHGNICIPSIFVSDSGDWKLGGFELMGELISCRILFSGHLHKFITSNPDSH